MGSKRLFPGSGFIVVRLNTVFPSCQEQYFPPKSWFEYDVCRLPKLFEDDSSAQCRISNRTYISSVLFPYFVKDDVSNSADRSAKTEPKISTSSRREVLISTCDP